MSPNITEPFGHCRISDLKVGDEIIKVETKCKAVTEC